MTLKAINLTLIDNSFFLTLNNDSIIRIPLSDFERLKNATTDELDNWRFIGNGIGINWPELDEDLLVDKLYSSYGVEPEGSLEIERMHLFKKFSFEWMYDLEVDKLIKDENPEYEVTVNVNGAFYGN